MLFEEPSQKALFAVDTRRWFVVWKLIVGMARSSSIDRAMIVILVIRLGLRKESHRQQWLLVWNEHEK